jgi:hypothetical protein
LDSDDGLAPESNADRKQSYQYQVLVINTKIFIQRCQICYMDINKGHKVKLKGVLE